MSLPSSKSQQSNAKSLGTPVHGRKIHAGDDLLFKLLTRPKPEGGIVHALQPVIVQEIIARIGMS